MICYLKQSARILNPLHPGVFKKKRKEGNMKGRTKQEARGTGFKISACLFLKIIWIQMICDLVEQSMKNLRV